MGLARFQQRDGNRGGGKGAQHFSGGQRLLAIAHWSLAAAAGNVAVDNLPVEQSGGASGGQSVSRGAEWLEIFFCCRGGGIIFFFFFFFFLWGRQGGGRSRKSFFNEGC